jgi:peptidoglycan/LPS O-acetylase OafA/YrhL
MTLTVALFIVLWQSPTFLNDFNLWIRLITATFDGSGPEGVGAFWSISTELQYYFLVPGLVILFFNLIGYINKKLLIIILAFSFMAIALIARNAEWMHHGATLAAWSPFVYEPLYSNIDAFGLGFCAAFLSTQPRKWLIRLSKWIWSPLLILSFVLYSKNIYPLMGLGIPGEEYQFAVTWPAINALLLASVVLFADIASRNTVYKQGKVFSATSWILSWAGGLTFAIYLVHSSILISVEKAFPDFSEVHKLFISVVLVLITSTLLHIFVERTSNRWRAKTFN